MKYVIIRTTGIYIFDKNVKLIEKIPIKLNYLEIDIVGKNKLPDSLKPYIKEGYIFLGQIFEGYEYETNPKLIKKALSQIKDENYLEIQEEVLKATIKRIADSVTRDLLIIRAVEMLDDLNKTINLLMERFREWYELYFPEISQKIEDHEKFIKTIIGKSREELLDELDIDLTMGGKLEEKDIEMLEKIATQIKNLYKLREDLKQYIESMMKELAPNLTKIAGPTIGARLLSLAGGLEKLANLPSSTIQVLGAEKSLFKHLRKGTPPPKHGVIFNHPFIQKLPKAYRGAMARTLASKIALAAKVDAFHPGKYIADELYYMLEKRFEQLKKGIKGKKIKNKN